MKYIISYIIIFMSFWLFLGCESELQRLQTRQVEDKDGYVKRIKLTYPDAKVYEYNDKATIAKRFVVITKDSVVIIIAPAYTNLSDPFDQCIYITRL